jgi:polysaccharide lyase-like protein
MQHRLALASCLCLIACAGTDEDGSGSDVPAFVGTVPSNAGPQPGASPAPTGATPPATGAPNPDDEAGVTPGSFLPSGAGGAANGSSANGTSTGGASTGGASTGGIGATDSTAGAAGSATAAAGTGSELPSPPVTPEPTPTEPTPPPPAQDPATSACPPNALFCDDFEDDAAGQFPGAPWQNNTGSGATVRVDSVQAFSGSQAVHVNAPPNGAYRRGYFSLGQGSGVFPALSRSLFGRAMMYLDATPNGVVHWTVIQAEGRAADNTHDAYYRYGGQQQNGAGLMANYETNGGVSTDCYSHSATRMPVQRWACVEWHFDAARNEMQLWLDGTELTDMHVVDRPTTAGSGCLGNDVNGEWLAPPNFTTLHLGWESYQTANDDRNLWVDDVAVGSERLGCPAQ